MYVYMYVCMYICMYVCMYVLIFLQNCERWTPRTIYILKGHCPRMVSVTKNMGHSVTKTVYIEVPTLNHYIASFWI